MVSKTQDESGQFKVTQDIFFPQRVAALQIKEIATRILILF